MMRRTKTAKLGQYVLTTKFSDAMWGDPWAIGYLCGINVTIINGNISDPSYVVCNAITAKMESPYLMGLKNCFKITEEEGENIIANSKEMPSGNMKIYGGENWAKVWAEEEKKREIK